MEIKSIKNIAMALGKFQSLCPAIDKGKKGYGYKYADLPAIIQTITPIFKTCNLSFTQLTGGDGESVSITTILIHNETGEYFETTISGSVKDNKGNMSFIQAQGSVITYLRRYSLGAILGIVTDEDIDGHVEPSTKTSAKSTGTATNTPAKPKDKPTLDLTSQSYTNAYTAYKGATSNDKRNNVKQSILKAYKNANEVLNKLEEDYKKHLAAKK